MVGIGPDLGNRFGVQRRAIRNHGFGRKPVVFQVSQEPQHVCPIVLRNQRTGNRMVRDRIAGEQDDSVPKMDFIDTKRAGKFAQNLGPKRRAVKFPNRVFQTVIEKSGGQPEQEVSLQRLGNGGRVELVDQNAINDCLPHLVVVPGLGFDIIGSRAEGLAATALGRVLAIVDFSPEFLLKCYRTNTTNSNPFTSSEFPTFWASCLSRMTRFSYSFGGCFLASMPGSFFCVVRKPNKSNQVFLCPDRTQSWWRLARSVLFSCNSGKWRAIYYTSLHS